MSSARLWLIAFLLGSAHLEGIAWAQAPEYAVKAAYVYNFARFVEWPGITKPALRICIFSESPLYGFLENAVRGKLAHGVPLEVMQVSESDANFDGCEVLFVGALSRGKVQTVLRKVKGHSILTVGESDEFAESGGMITLVVDGERVRFKLNLASATDAHLQISSKLAELGRRVGASR